VLNSTKEVLITGGRGYIGMNLTHFLLSEGFKVHNLDMLQTSPFGPLPRDVVQTVLDLTDGTATQELEKSLRKLNKNATVIHLAGLKSVEESFSKEFEYRETNFEATRYLIEAMKRSGLSRLIFASTAAIYGDIKDPEPISENVQTTPISPYAQSKIDAERIIRTAHDEWGLNYSTLRFFNVAGSILPNLIEYSGKNLIPIILRAMKAEVSFNVFGDKFDTKDGSAVRDYIHIEDLCNAHLKVIEKLKTQSIGEINVGSGKGYSVFEIIHTLEQLSGKKIKYKVESARAGDAPAVVADITKAKNLIGWQPSKSLAEMLTSSLSESL
jgi:UDP-glucose 4-epimerase